MIAVCIGLRPIARRRVVASGGLEDRREIDAGPHGRRVAAKNGALHALESKK